MAIDDLNEGAKELLGTFGEYRNAVRASAEELGRQTNQLSEIRSIYGQLDTQLKSLQNSEEGISRLNDKQLSSIRERATAQVAEIQRQAQLFKDKITAQNESLLLDKNGNELNSSQLRLRLRSLVATGELTDEQANLLQISADNFAIEKETLAAIDAEVSRREDVNKSLGVAGNLLKGISAIGGKFAKAFNLDKVSEDMEKFADKMADGEKRASRLAVLGVGVRSAFSNLGETLTDPTVVFGALAKSFGEFEKANTEVRNLTGQSASNMEVFSTSMTSTIDAAKAIGSLTKEIGINVNAAFSASTITAAAELTNLLGVSEKSAANLALRAEAFGGTLKGVDESVFNTVKGFNMQNRAAVNVGAVLEDVGNASNSLALSLGGSSDELAEAAAGAQRLGLNLASAEKIADTLLDFESSIANELQAELLTGKEINLEGARQAALNNDIDALTKEIGDNQEILSAFSSGNRIQQDAIAKSLGMSKDEVAKMILLRQKENGLTDEQAAKAAGINIETAKRLGAQESIKKSIEKITAALAPTLAVIADGIAMITGNAGGLITTFTVIGFALLPKLVKGAKDLASGFRDSAKIVKNLATKGIKGMTDGLSKTTGAAAKTSKSLAGAPGKGIRSFFQNLAAGLRSMGKGPVLKGVLALALFAPAALIATAAIPFLAFIAIPGVGAGISAGLIGIGSGLASLGAVAASGVAFLAPLLLLALGAAMIPFAFSLRLLTPLVEAFGVIFIGVFNALPPIIAAVAEGIVTIFGGIGDLVSSVVGSLISLADPTIALGLYMIAPALAVLGFSMISFSYGLGLLGGALLLAAPGLAIGSFTLPLISPAIIQLGEALKGIDPSLFLQMGLSFIPFAAGLALLGGALLLAAPGLTIGSFTLPLIGPAITQLGEALKGIDPSLFFQFGIGMTALTAAFAIAGTAFPLIIGGSFALSMALTPLTAVLMAAAPSMFMFSDAITALGSIDYSNLLGLAEVLPALALGIGAFALSAGILSILTGGNPFSMFDGLAENAPGIDLASNALSNMSIALGNLQTALAGVDTEKLSDVMNPGLGGVVLGLGTSAIQGVTDAVGSIAGALGGGGEEEGNQAIVAELQEVKVLLSQILNKEGAVNIDSTKAGTAFSMGTSRLQ